MVTETDKNAADAAYAKPLPVLTEENRGHWEAARRGELRLQRCSACGYTRFPIATICPRCSSFESEWALLSGRGTVTSWVVFHKAYWPAFASDVPYIVAQIELAEGPRYTSNLIQLDGQEVTIGMPVEVLFEDVTADVSLPKFRPVRGG